MDTLIDNRIFPQEMQEQPKPKNPKKKEKYIYSLTLFFALIIIIFIFYVLIYKKDTSVVEEIPETYTQKQSLVVEKLENSVPKMTEEERTKRINAFFASE